VALLALRNPVRIRKRKQQSGFIRVDRLNSPSPVRLDSQLLPPSIRRPSHPLDRSSMDRGIRDMVTGSVQNIDPEPEVGLSSP
jgi:hypothetical protein